MVIGLPASICCQCRAENPKPIMSSCVCPFALRSFFTRSPKARKNCPSSTTVVLLATAYLRTTSRLAGYICVLSKSRAACKTKS